MPWVQYLVYKEVCHLLRQTTENLHVLELVCGNYLFLVWSCCVWLVMFIFLFLFYIPFVRKHKSLLNGVQWH